ncbi:U3 small nucleolar RNA-associated protein [Colletotrichum higginsianum IMI 349063]|uniref:U3 small nucleolar RNA-associated protein n=2 Tax=Colletotrichum higginsianum TaxID=80884 RepID=A0A1B7YUJ9_COLHI|nr:U3 small nucleolar RNA-associated protein [Colletotrichum higginsianum IMI 349063]OBR15632.1 U3 small nucleolar RNA-associated protein [Colletotrichum higginsianum IMI 349063]TID03999.1 putative U3 small nucleolar RNA-associated protein 18 [Colletotrichum higginsianum]
MAKDQPFEQFSDEEEEVTSSEESELEEETPRQGKPKPVFDEKDSDEEELEKLVLGGKADFREQLFRNDVLGDIERLEKEQNLQLTKPDDPTLENVADHDLFFLDTGVPAAKGSQAGKATNQEQTDAEGAPAWEDSDDERLTVSLATATRLRKLRLTEAEDVVSGAEYSRRLRTQFLRLNPLPKWAQDSEEGRPAKRRRRSSAAATASDSSISSDEEGDDSSDTELSAAPLDKFLRDVRRLAGRDATGKTRLRPEVIDIQRTREIPDAHKAAVNNLSFHPKYPVLLSSSVSSVLYLHHLNPTAHPTPNPMLTSVQAKGVDVRRAEFLYPAGDQIFFAGRRKFFHSWDLESGHVQKTSQIQGHRLEHKTMERFKLSPCGRYMGLVASTRKGGGIINIVSTESRQWIAAARLDSRHGIADFAWWSTGDGLSILGKDGSVGEYSMEERKFLAVWRDEGCVGGIVIALGGHRGPELLGDDRWVAVGSSSGITNIYDRETLVKTSKTGEVSVETQPEPARRFEQLVTPITVLTFSPDGQLLAFGSRETKDALRLVHLPSCTVYRNWPTAQTPLGRITSVAFGRSSELLAVGNDTGKIRMWEIRS